MSAPGSATYDIGKGDADDEEWFDALAKKNKREDKLKYGGGSPEPKAGGKKGRESAAALAAKAEAKATRRNDPYMLRAGSGGGAVSGAPHSRGVAGV